jgi:hypothetical protein
VELEAVRITARRGRNFYAELDTVGPRGRQVISCRPSDALALVLRQRMPTPVLVADWVFDTEDSEIPAIDADPAVAPGASPAVPTGGTEASETPMLDPPAPGSSPAATIDDAEG